MNSLSSDLLHWYFLNKRDLPWRETKDPYKIWLSEIIFQQTRIDQGISYYLKFIEHFPHVHALANVNEQEVLNLWQGLGYYSRARNLHLTAQKISYELNGQFPNSLKELKELKGVGDYTAAAIASIAFDIPVPVVDGNVFRVISRLFAIEKPIDSSETKKIITGKMKELIVHDKPGDFNQAVMEFGALYCKPVNPDCKNCIFQNRCLAHRKGLVGRLPHKGKKIKITNRYFHYLVLKRNTGVGKILIRKRIKKDIWQNLFDFPMIEFLSEVDYHDVVKGFDEKYGIDLEKFNPEISVGFKHVLTHRTIFAKFYSVFIPDTEIINFVEKEEFILVQETDLDDFPFPRLITKYFEKRS